MTDKESYVNVADLKRKLRAFAKYRRYSKSATDELLGVVSKLKISIKADLETTLESTDVQPVKHGKWKYYKNNGIIDTYICTNCQCKVEMAIDVEPSRFKYCPNCGAGMRGDTNG